MASISFLAVAKLIPSPEVLELWRNAQASRKAAASWLSWLNSCLDSSLQANSDAATVLLLQAVCFDVDSTL